MKFWNKLGNDIYIYGDIVSGEKWFDSDVTTKSFSEDLSACTGAVTVHINSSGGSIFEALTIYNLLKDYSAGVTVSIEGLCASAASLVAMSGRPVKMAANALMMIHAPAVTLGGVYSEADLDKVKALLLKVEGALIQTYSTRLKGDIKNLLEAETWFDAQEALAAGLIDEISEEIPLQIDNAKDLLFVNKLAVDMKNFESLQKKLSARASFKNFSYVVQDNLTSGAEKISAQEKISTSAQAELIIKYANQRREK